MKHLFIALTLIVFCFHKAHAQNDTLFVDSNTVNYPGYP